MNTNMRIRTSIVTSILMMAVTATVMDMLTTMVIPTRRKARYRKRGDA